MTADRTAYRTPPRWLRGWRLLVALSAGFLFTVVFTGMMIVICAGNLDPVLAQAKRDGLPISIAELSRPPSSNATIIQQRMRSLSAAMAAYGGNYWRANFAPDISIRAGPQYGIVGKPIPEGLRQHVAKWSDAQRLELKSLLDDMLVPLHAPHDPSSAPDPTSCYAYARLGQDIFTLGLESFSADSSPQVADAVRLLNSTRCFAPDSMHLALTRVLAAGEVARLCRYHLDALRSQDVTSLAAGLRQHATEWPTLLPEASAAEFALTVHALQMNPEHRARSLGIALPGLLEKPLIMPLFQRLSRVSILDRARQYSAAAQSSADPYGPDARAIFVRPRWNVPLWLMEMSCYYPAGQGAWGPVVKMTTLRMLVTAAALDGSPWPIDPDSPGKSPLKELRRSDDICYAVYSVGRNGVDDGGKGDDRVITLRKPPESTSTSSAPPIPSPPSPAPP